MRTFFFAGLFVCFSLRLAAQEMAQEPAPAPSGPGGEPAAVTNAAERAEPETPKSRFFVETAMEYADEGEYEAAERAYLSALEKDPEDPDIRFRLGTLYLLMQRYEDAEPILKKLTEEYPDNATAHNNLAWLYATGGKMKDGVKALRHAREALLSVPDSPALWNSLAEAYYVSGRYEKSLRAAEQALDLLQARNAGEEETRAYVDQVIKIRRAQEALEMMEGTDGE